MASSLERSLYPQAGLTPTSGVQYFGNTGRGMNVDYFSQIPPSVQAPASSRPVANINPGFTTPAASESSETPGAGFLTTPTELGFGGEGTAAPGAPGGGISPGTAATIGNAASVAGLMGAVTGNQGVSQAAGVVGAANAAAQGNLGPTAAIGASLMGASPALAGLVGLGATGLSTGSVSNAAIGSTAGSVIGGMAFGPIGAFVGSLLGKAVAETAGNTSVSVGESATPGGTTVSGSINGQGFSFSEAAPGATSDGTTGPGSATGIGVGSTSGINGMDAASDAAAAASDAAAAANGGDSAGAGVGGVGAGDGGGGIGAGEGLADGGLIGDRPGITKRYADGGPLLAMGFADGGRIAMGAVPSNASVNDRVNAILRNPKMRQNIVARAQQLMDSGELTPEEVMTMGRVAEAAMYNPSLYPQLRQFVASQGMTPLPAAYDPSVVTKIIAVSRALQQSTPAGQVPPTTAAAVSPPAPGMRKGGMIHGPGTGRSDSIGTINESTGEPVRVANGEYIIPEHVVRVKGREFFDNLLRRYADVPKES